MAEQIGSAASYIGTIERGDANISLGMLARLASVVGVAPKILINEALPGHDTSGSFHQFASAVQESISLQRAVLASSAASCDTMETVVKAILEALRKPSQAADTIKKLGQRQRSPKTKSTLNPR